MLKTIGVNQRERRLISNLYGETDIKDIKRGVRQGNYMLPILFNLYWEYLMKEALAEVGDFKVTGRIINKMILADDTAIEAGLQEKQEDTG